MPEDKMRSGLEYRSFVRKKIYFLIFLFLFTIVVFLLAIALGSSSVSLGRVLRTLFGHGEKKDSIIILSIRLPRAVTAIAAGFGLGIVGCVMQSVLRNPLASASTIGVSQGAAFGAAFAIIVLGGGMMSAGSTGAQLNVNNPVVTTLCAFFFAMVSTIFVLCLSQFREINASTLVLAGVALSSLFSAGTTLLEYFADDVRVAAVVYWTFGDLGSTFWKEIIVMGTVVVFAATYFQLNSWNYNAMQGGEETAKGLGVKTQSTILCSMVVGSFTAAVIVSYIGIISFVGLIAPHLVRKFVGSDYRYLLPAAGLAGANLLLVSDLLSRLIISPIVLPIGAITSILGAPVFLWIILKRGRH